VNLHSLFVAIATLLAGMAISTSLSRWLGLGTVLAMLLAGVALGPFGFQITPNVERLRGFTELGVVLLMFAIGLEMEPRRLWAMRRLVFGLGGLQIVGTAALIAGFIFARHLGVAVFSGMLGVTIFGIFFTPVFYVVIRWLTERKGPTAADKAAEVALAHGAALDTAITKADGQSGKTDTGHTAP